MPKVKEIKEETENENAKSWIQERLSNLREDGKFKGTDFNEEKGEDWRVSTGSIILDHALSSDGRPGVGPQIIKIYGDFGTGKTSFLLNIASNFQKLGPNYFVYIANAEGRITELLLKQAGISTDPTQFYIDHCQQAETVFSKIRILMTENSTKSKKDYIYICVLIDSMDALIKKADDDTLNEKGFEGNFNPGGNAVISKTFLKTTSLPITRGKHLMLLSGQTISIIGATKNQKKTMASGGAGAKYFSSTMLEVKKAWTNTKIWDGDKEIGHYFDLYIEKSINNQRIGDSVLVPIKRNFEDGSAVWREIECKDLMLGWGFLKKGAGGRFEIPEEYSKELLDQGIEHETKFHGDLKVIEYLEGNIKLTDYTINKLKSLLFS